MILDESAYFLMLNNSFASIILSKRTTPLFCFCLCF